MGKIKLLDQNTINQIAAGEVIDRPASIVKELMENSIDANSSIITVEVKEGGLSLIRITDNGQGFDKSDIEIAFKRHATSKIHSALDLASVSSLGFRGEALSSIAAVCQVELITKNEIDLTGTRYRIDGGKEIGNEEIGAPMGTTFIAKNIFFNTPARRKFLKSAGSEGGYISEIVEKIALSHPEVSINFINNGKSKFHTSGNGNLKDVIYNIYGKEITDNLLPINCSNDFIKISGYIGKGIISKGNRNFENYFINGRYIKSDIISKAIEEGYKFILMQHKFPFTTIAFEINPEYLDVNVHPSKMELRFRNGNDIYPFIWNNIHDVLTERPNIIKVSLEKEKEIAEEKINVPEPFEINRNAINNNIDIKEEISEYNTNKTIEDIDQKPYPNIIEQNIKAGFLKNGEKEFVQKEIINEYDDFLTEKARKHHKIIGQIFDTYWLVEYDENLYIIDQHAAHEKVMFERLMTNLKNKNISTQLINPPIILSLSMNEANLLNSYLENFKELGFNIEPFGGEDFSVRGIPSDLYSLDDKEVLMNLIDNLSSESGKLTSDLLNEKIASMSCKAAVKGNMRISLQEADKLIEELLSLDNPYNCPHGRPTIISMSKYELEKKFKRIL